MTKSAPQFDQNEPPQEAGSTGWQHSVEKEVGLNHTAKPPWATAPVKAERRGRPRRMALRQSQGRFFDMLGRLVHRDFAKSA
ncbi:hypothetical protein [Sulfitobacter geojensis]|uniref:Uncharacterized protein n=1 Tax=Sulfitobacter geojensis TaxID=1342299 RepID=A0AAE3B7U7_9RHOB|nr:hypothetical protein [Sulfitobacter geojensis]MBM1690675.1 hypothetical protein [Sulfitobacter geojensis]MBM1694741.1 hypothetical protein [Sulfitobacter geojensis]MBM1707553.1 hypothetical protein [Sulfitobacter geojensis]MBM1711163.1 hypothetical protein [Sulfitobacter geojensis]MBM1715678.1 hypothetical protein [Sulfitobacter geojensis]